MVFLILYTFFFLPARIIIGFGGGSEDDSTVDFADPWTLRCVARVDHTRGFATDLRLCFAVT
jgi:hypothetical protein